MKKVKIMLLMLTLFLGYGYAQERLEVQRVDSPYRLLKGPMLISDLRMSATILNGFSRGQVTATARNNGYKSDVQDQTERTVSVFFRNQILGPNPIGNQPAIVLDGFLIDNNSPRFLIGQSPFAKVPWRFPW